jgi:hypothetical protein
MSGISPAGMMFFMFQRQNVAANQQISDEGSWDDSKGGRITLIR